MEIRVVRLAIATASWAIAPKGLCSHAIAIIYSEPYISHL